MTNTGTLQVTTPTDREIAMTRVFDAPRSWSSTPGRSPSCSSAGWAAGTGWTMAVCEIDLRVGGAVSLRLARPDGHGDGDGRRLPRDRAPERLVSTEKFDEAWYAGEALDTLILVEQDGKTTITHGALRVAGSSRRGARDRGMEQGVSVSYERLAELPGSIDDGRLERGRCAWRGLRRHAYS